MNRREFIPVLATMFSALSSRAQEHNASATDMLTTFFPDMHRPNIDPEMLKGLEAYLYSLPPIPGFEPAPPANLFWVYGGSFLEERLFPEVPFMYASNVHTPLTLNIAFEEGRQADKKIGIDFDQFVQEGKSVLSEFNNIPASRLKINFVSPDYKEGSFILVRAEAHEGTNVAGESTNPQSNMPDIIDMKEFTYPGQEGSHRRPLVKMTARINLAHPRLVVAEGREKAFRHEVFGHIVFKFGDPFVPRVAGEIDPPRAENAPLCNAVLGSSSATVMAGIEAGGWGILDQAYLDRTIYTVPVPVQMAPQATTYKISNHRHMYIVKGRGQDTLDARGTPLAAISFDPRYVGRAGKEKGEFNNLYIPKGAAGITRVLMNDEYNIAVPAHTPEANGPRQWMTGKGQNFFMVNSPDVGANILMSENSARPYYEIRFLYDIKAPPQCVNATDTPSAKRVRFRFAPDHYFDIGTKDKVVFALTGKDGKTVGITVDLSKETPAQINTRLAKEFGNILNPRQKLAATPPSPRPSQLQPLQKKLG